MPSRPDPASPPSTRRHDEAATRLGESADAHARAATFWDEHGDRTRAQLQRDLAAHQRAGAILQRRWDALPDIAPGRADANPPQTSIADQDDVREIELEIRETQAGAREQSLTRRERIADAREHDADRRDTAADTREHDADQREHLADQREGTAHAREVERLHRLAQASARKHASARRDQATIEREQAAGQPDPLLLDRPD